MNAVATPTRAKNAGASVKNTLAASPLTARIAMQIAPADAIKAAFSQVEVLLSQAYMTDEDHGGSGDSDRLLSIAHDVADRAWVHPPSDPRLSRAAFDIAALIRAARLVPGDGESLQRKALIDQAAVHLNWLTECDIRGEDCCDPGAQRPSTPDAGSKAAPRPAADCVAAAWFRAREAQAVLWASIENYNAPETVTALHTLMAISVAKLEALNVKISEEGCKDASSILAQAIAIAAFLAEEVNGYRWEILLDASLSLMVRAKEQLDQSMEAIGHA